MFKWLIFITVFFVACKGSSGVPGGVLDYNEMKEVLWDMAQVDEFVIAYVHGEPQKTKNENLLLYQKVFALHKISNDAFTKSYTFYRTHPLQEKVLMDSLFQFSSRQRQERYIAPPVPARLLKLLNPAPMKMGNMPNDWHQYQFPTNFAYE